MRSTSRITRRWGLLAFCAWLALLPLPFGAGRTWALAMVLPPLFAIAAAVSWTHRSVHASLPAFLLRPPGLLLAAFCAVLVAQIVPWNGGQPLSVVPYRTQLYLLVAVACTVAFWLVTVLVRSDEDLRWLLLALVGCGLLQAVLAVTMMSARMGFGFLDSEIRPSSVATGTFVNRNHLAGYLNIALAAGIGLLVGQLAPPREGRRWALRVRDWLEVLLGGKARLRLVLVMLVIVLIATRSRMGNAAFFFALLVTASVYAVFTRERRRGVMLFVASVIAVDLALIGAWVGVDRVVERIQATPLLEPVARSAQPGALPGASPEAAPDAPADGPSDVAAGDAAGDAAAPAQAAAEPPPAVRDPRLQQSVEKRIEPALDAARIVREHPWLGTGGGTFYLVYMAYQPNWDGFYNHAHNDYLEIAADTGLLGLGALLALATYALWVALGILRTRSNPVLRGAAFASIMSISAMAMHALVDFNLHIPANAITFTVMVALPFAARALHARRSPRGESSTPAPARGAAGGDAAPAALQGAA